MEPRFPRLPAIPKDLALDGANYISGRTRSLRWSRSGILPLRASEVRQKGGACEQSAGLVKKRPPGEANLRCVGLIHNGSHNGTKRGLFTDFLPEAASY
jgi:hypothetical protein